MTGKKVSDVSCYYLGIIKVHSLFGFLCLRILGATILLHTAAVFAGNTSHNEINNIISKADALERVFPDSAIAYYNTALEKAEKLRDGSKETLLLKYKINTRIGLLYQYRTKYFLAYEYFRKAIEAAVAAKDKLREAEGIFNIAESYLENGSYNLAIMYYNSALEIYEELEDTEGIFWSRIGLGLVNRECGNAKLSKEHYEKALEAASAAGNKFYIAVCYNNLGNLYKQKGDFNTSLNYMRVALKEFRLSGEQTHISDCLDGIGELYYDYGDYHKALDNMKSSMEMAESINDKYRLFARYVNMAKILTALDQYDEALQYINKTMGLAELVGDKSRMGEALLVISDFYGKSGDYAKMVLNISRAAAVSAEIGDTVSLVKAKMFLAEVKNEKGEKNEASELASEVLKTARDKELPDLVKRAAFLLSGNSAAAGDYKSAFEYFRMYSVASDTILNKEKLKKIEELSARYSFEKMENDKLLIQNKALQAESALQLRNILLIILTGCLLIVSVLLYRYFRSRKETEKENQRKEIHLTRKIDFLQSQVDSKNRELTAKATLITQNDRFIGEVLEAIDKCLNGPADEKSELRKLRNHLENNYRQESWEDFLKHFEEVHPEFYKKITAEHNNLSANEIKICAFLKMNLNTKEIAQITNQTVKSIEVARTRIRKKLSIEHSDNLVSAIQNL